MEVGMQKNMGFEETELRLGLPGGCPNPTAEGGDQPRKRAFSQTVDLKLNLSSKEPPVDDPDSTPQDIKPNEKTLLNDPAKPPAKAQVVGWPPVRSFRKNILKSSGGRGGNNEENDKGSNGNAAFVKVSMDGAPYLRKVDLKMYKSYQELSDALANMFTTIGSCGYRDFMSEGKLMDVLNGSDNVPTYEDKDGDWMLVGDVPWEMFVESCKRLRIMKGTEAIGLAPRAMEKCKNRS